MIGGASLVAVRSSDLAAVGYDNFLNRLYIEFHQGSLYEYYGVSAITYSNLMAAASHGRYFNRFIRGRYRYRRLR